MKSIQRNIKRLQITLVTALVLAVSPTFATTITVLDENFDDIPGLSTSGATRTVADIIANSPGQLPAGTSWYSGNASPDNALNINVRRTDNIINTWTGTEGFDSFFAPATSSNKFLVLGDNSAQIGGNPSAGVMTLSFPLILPGGARSVDISFRYAFDGYDSIAADDTFSVLLTNGSDLEILKILSPDARPYGSAGNIAADTFMQTILAVDLPSTTDLMLTFRLSESSSSSTNTAVGIDDIVVTAQAPEPSSLLLLGSGLISFGILARRYRKKS